MGYFKIGNTDFSMYVSNLKITYNNNYTAQTNAKGDTVVDYLNTKRTIEVKIIAIDDYVMKNILAAINSFNVSISYRNPKTNVLEEGVKCVIPTNAVDYFTIQSNKVLYNGFSLKFVEL